MVEREGYPTFNEYDIIVVDFGYKYQEFVVMPQTDGNGLAVRFLHSDGKLGDIWVLAKNTFNRSWSTTGKYTGPKVTRRSFWARIFG